MKLIWIKKTFFVYFSEEDDYEEELSEYSDDSVRRQPQPTRRSVRNRKNVVDPDFSKS